MITKTIYLKIVSDYLVKVMNGMAMGLFASLIIGLILKQIGLITNITILISLGTIAQYCMGAAIGAGVAFTLGAPSLGIFSCIICGVIGSNTIIFDGSQALLKIGEPVGAMVAAVIGAEVSKFVNNKTPINIIIIPISTIIAGGIIGIYISPFIAQFMQYLGTLINTATTFHPLWMGIIISFSMGLLLTMPISSAAIAISLSLSGIAAGAATVGCCSHMIGFAVASFKDNKWGGLISQGIGTSMLQVPNIIRKPLILIPAIISSLILGPIATMIFHLQSNSVGAGMGTSGFVGQFMAIETMGHNHIIMIIALTIIAPAIISYIISSYMRKKGYLKPGDMKL